MEGAVTVPKQAKAPPLLDGEETIPAGMVRIDHSEGPGKVLRVLSAQDLLGRVDEFHFDARLVWLLEFEGNAGLRVFVTNH
jgi:hypothetical protein